MEKEITIEWWYNTSWDIQIGKININYIIK
jgi:hypothetical protein